MDIVDNVAGFEWIDVSVNPEFAVQQSRLCNKAKGYLHEINDGFALQLCPLQWSSEERRPDSDRCKIPPHHFGSQQKPRQDLLELPHFR